MTDWRRINPATLSSFMGNNHFLFPVQVALQATTTEGEILLGKGSRHGPELVQRNLANAAVWPAGKSRPTVDVESAMEHRPVKGRKFILTLP